LPDPHRVNLRSSRLIAKPASNLLLRIPGTRTSDNAVRWIAGLQPATRALTTRWPAFAERASIS